MKFLFLILSVLVRLNASSQDGTNIFLFTHKIPNLNGPVQKQISYNCKTDSTGTKKQDTLSVIEFSESGLPVSLREFRRGVVSATFKFSHEDTLLTSTVRIDKTTSDFFYYTYHQNGYLKDVILKNEMSKMQMHESYNESGKDKFTIYYNSNGSYAEVYTYEYYEDGRIKSSLSVSPDENPALNDSVNSVYYYGEDLILDSLVQHYTWRNLVFKTYFEYYASGELYSDYITLGDGKTKADVHYYDKAGRITAFKKYQVSGAIIESDEYTYDESGNQLTHTSIKKDLGKKVQTIRTFNDLNLCVKEEIITDFKGTIEKTTTHFKYNKQNLLLEKSIYTGNNELLSTYRYYYDTYNNLIKVEVTENGNTYLVEHYEYFYSEK